MKKKHFHFSGVCGTAMASLAVLLKKRGHLVTGSDENTYPPMSDFLAENGIEILSPYKAENLRLHPDAAVLGNALSRGNPEVEYALEARLCYTSMAELLKNEFIRGNISVVISGSHGKTTVSAMVAHVLSRCGKETGFMIGGIPENFGSSCMDVDPGGYFVVEGDEYDSGFFDKRSKFFHYLPDRLIITNIEFDHGDIFKDIEEIKKSFSLMLRQIPKNGLIIVNGDDPDAMEVAKTGFTPYISYGKSKNCDAVISSYQPLTNCIGSTFEMTFQGSTRRFYLPLAGEFNVFNAAATILLATREEISAEKIQDALNSFKNVRRRLQLLSKNELVQVFDDFAHHPTAIAETVKALRQAWPKSVIHAIYEARSNTSVRKFHQSKMAWAFENADSVIFYKLHRLEQINPEERLDLGLTVEELRRGGSEASLIENIDKILERCLEVAEPGHIFLTMSNGGFGGLAHKLAEVLDKKFEIKKTSSNI